MKTPTHFPEAVEAEGQGPAAIVTLEIVSYEQHRFPLVPGGGRSVGAALDEALLIAQREGKRPKSVTVDLPPEFWDTAEVG